MVRLISVFSLTNSFSLILCSIILPVSMFSSYISLNSTFNLLFIIQLVASSTVIVLKSGIFIATPADTVIVIFVSLIFISSSLFVLWLSTSFFDLSLNSYLISYLIPFLFNHSSASNNFIPTRFSIVTVSLISEPSDITNVISLFLLISPFLSCAIIVSLSISDISKLIVTLFMKFLSINSIKSSKFLPIILGTINSLS